MERKSLEEQQRQLGPERVKSWLLKNGINAQKTDSGAFMKLCKPGLGRHIKKGDHLRIKYRLSAISGRLIDPNLDTLFHHLPFLDYEVGSRRIFPCLDQLITELRPGSVANIYIPVMHGWGARPNGNNSVLYEDLKLKLTISSNNKEPGRDQ